MVKAMHAVKLGRLGVNRAALEYEVPKTTLKNSLSGKVVHGNKSGPDPYLTREEERELASFWPVLVKWSKGKLSKKLNA